MIIGTRIGYAQTLPLLGVMLGPGEPLVPILWDLLILKMDGCEYIGTLGIVTSVEAKMAGCYKHGCGVQALNFASRATTNGIFAHVNHTH